MVSKNDTEVYHFGVLRVGGRHGRNLGEKGGANARPLMFLLPKNSFLGAKELKSK